MKQFFRTYYAPNNATLVIAGDFQRDSARGVGEPLLRRHPARPRDSRRRPRCRPSTVPRDTFLVLEDKVTLPRLYETWHSVKLFHPDDAPLDVLADVLAGDKNSRLYKRLVFDMQVAQDVSAFQNSQRLDGYFQIIGDAEAGADAEPTWRSWWTRRSARSSRDGVTARELARALNSRRASFLDRIASVLGKADRLD